MHTAPTSQGGTDMSRIPQGSQGGQGGNCEGSSLGENVVFFPDVGEGGVASFLLPIILHFVECCGLLLLGKRVEI
jgi:hypothetical protein